MSELEHLGFVDVADDSRELFQPKLDGGLVAAFARHDLEPLAARPHDQRLDMPFSKSRPSARQVAHDLPRLVRVGVDELDQSGGLTGCRRRGQRLHVCRLTHGTESQSSSRHDR
jgi:hypothetical protein